MAGGSSCLAASEATCAFVNAVPRHWLVTGGEAGQGGFHYQRGDGAEIVEYTFQRVPVLRPQIR